MGDFKISIVEDDPWYGQLLQHHLSLNPDYEIKLYNSAQSCLKDVSFKPHIICLDYGLPDMTGDKLLEKIKNINQNIAVIVISGQEEIDVAVNLLKSGADDYIIKNDHTQEILWKSIIQIRENLTLRQEVEELKEQLEQRYSFENSIIGNSTVIKDTFRLIEKAINSNINVSITGETGTGKEVVARAIHFNSSRKKKKFIAVNMAAIPKDLLESELFGHEKGAFTGANNQKIGKFEEAHEGTIFLDEIAEMDLNLQSKILRVIQEREVVRVGGNQSIKFDARLIIATHKDLTHEVRKGNFREDLYYRIFGLPIELPPLRDRDQDSLILAKHFVEEYSKNNKIKPLIITPEAKTKISKYHFPGNIRELKAIVELACVMSNGKEIYPEDITFHQLRKDDFFTVQEKTLREYNRDIITYFLEQNKNNVVKVAEKLDIGKSTIYNMLKSGEIKPA